MLSATASSTSDCYGVTSGPWCIISRCFCSGQRCSVGSRFRRVLLIKSCRYRQVCSRRGRRRVALLAAGKNDWTRSTGTGCSSYYSGRDGSPQLMVWKFPRTLILKSRHHCMSGYMAVEIRRRTCISSIGMTRKSQIAPADDSGPSF